MNRLMFLSVLILALGAQAAQPMPPTIAASLVVVGGGSGATVTEDGASSGGTNATRIAAEINGRTVPFAYTTPADPVATNPCSASTAAEFDACVVSGNVITVTSSFTGGVTIDVDDIDVLMDNAYTITGNLQIGGASYANRIRWTGGNVNGRVMIARGRDVLWDDFYGYVDGNAANAPHDFATAGQPFDRVALLNSTLQVTAPGNTDNWALYFMPTTGHSNLILANVKLLSHAQNNRFNFVENFIIVDSVFNPDGASSNGMRIHYNSNDVWIKDSWGRGLFKVDPAGVEPGPSITNATFDNFDRYFTQYLFSGVMENTGTVLNSNLYHTDGASDGTFSSFTPLTDGGGNVRVGWDGSTVPDYSGVGAVR